MSLKQDQNKPWLNLSEQTMINYIKASNEEVGQHDQNAYTKYQTTKTRNSQAEHKSMALVKAFQHIYEFKKM